MFTDYLRRFVQQVVFYYRRWQGFECVQKHTQVLTAVLPKIRGGEREM